MGAAPKPFTLPDLDTQRAIAEMMTRLDDHARLLCKQLELAQEIRHEALHRLVAS